MSFHITLVSNPSDSHTPVAYRTTLHNNPSLLSQLFYQPLKHYGTTALSANQTANDRMLDIIFKEHVKTYYQDVVETMRACPRDRFLGG